MHIDKFNSYVRILSTRFWVRHWYNFYDVPLFTDHKRTMAISLIDLVDRKNMFEEVCRDLKKAGFDVRVKLDATSPYPYAELVAFVERTDWPIV